LAGNLRFQLAFQVRIRKLLYYQVRKDGHVVAQGDRGKFLCGERGDLGPIAAHIAAVLYHR
jgi:hypothetical protein